MYSSLKYYHNDNVKVDVMGGNVARLGDKRIHTTF